ncbi:MAG: hypothetical protein ACK5JT_16800 [Hyphomicrobiaceae bacterium]
MQAQGGGVSLRIPVVVALAALMSGIVVDLDGIAWVLDARRTQETVTTRPVPNPTIWQAWRKVGDAAGGRGPYNDRYAGTKADYQVAHGWSIGADPAGRAEATSNADDRGARAARETAERFANPDEPAEATGRRGRIPAGSINLAARELDEAPGPDRADAMEERVTGWENHHPARSHPIQSAAEKSAAKTSKPLVVVETAEVHTPAANAAPAAPVMPAVAHRNARQDSAVAKDAIAVQSPASPSPVVMNRAANETVSAVVTAAVPEQSASVDMRDDLLPRPPSERAGQDFRDITLAELVAMVRRQSQKSNLGNPPAATTSKRLPVQSPVASKAGDDDEPESRASKHRRHRRVERQEPATRNAPEPPREVKYRPRPPAGSWTGLDNSRFTRPTVQGSFLKLLRSAP